MNKKICLTALTIFALIGTGLYLRGEWNMDIITGGKTYTNTRFGYELDLPKGFHVPTLINSFSEAVKETDTPSPQVVVQMSKTINLSALDSVTFSDSTSAEEEEVLSLLSEQNTIPENFPGNNIFVSLQYSSSTEVVKQEGSEVTKFKTKNGYEGQAIKRRGSAVTVKFVHVYFPFNTKMEDGGEPNRITITSFDEEISLDLLIGMADSIRRI